MQKDDTGKKLFEEMVETLFNYVEDDQHITVGTFGRHNIPTEAIAYCAIECPDMKTLNEKISILCILCSDAARGNGINNIFSCSPLLEGRTKGLTFTIIRNRDNIYIIYQSKFEVNGKPALYSESIVPMNDETYQDFKEKIEGNGGLVLMFSRNNDLMPIVYLTIDEVTFTEKI